MSTSMIVRTFPRFNIPIHDCRVHEELLQDIYRVNLKHTKSSSIKIDLGNNLPTYLVTIPRSKNVERMVANDQKYHWVNALLSSLSDEQPLEKTMEQLLVFIGSRPAYKDAFLNAMKDLGLSLNPKLDKETTFAIQSASNLNFVQMRELRRNLKVAIGTNIFAAEYKI